MDTEVVIVGAGPTGLALAVALRARGVDTVLLDRQAAGANTSRAAVVHARTLEVLTDLDVARRLVDAGLIVRRFSFRDGRKPLLHLEFDGLPTDYPFALMIPQNATEAILEQRLTELGGEVRRPCEVREVHQDGVTLADGTRITARYVVGADGMHSIVREQAGIGFVGAAYEQSFVLADVALRWSLPPTDGQLFFDPAGVMVVVPLPGGRWRVVATVDTAPEQPVAADIETLLRERGPGGEVRVDDLHWSSRFRVHHRLAEHYRAGNILLAGDAAHVHSPAGGQGMNTGIQDAVALAAAIATDTIGGYEANRRPVAEGVVRFTDLTTRAATAHSAPARLLRNTVMRTVGRVPRFRRSVTMRMAELNIR